MLLSPHPLYHNAFLSTLSPGQFSTDRDFVLFICPVADRSTSVDHANEGHIWYNSIYYSGILFTSFSNDNCFVDLRNLNGFQLSNWLRTKVSYLYSFQETFLHPGCVSANMLYCYTWFCFPNCTISKLFLLDFFWPSVYQSHFEFSLFKTLVTLFNLVYNCKPNKPACYSTISDQAQKS